MYKRQALYQADGVRAPYGLRRTRPFPAAQYVNGALGGRLNNPVFHRHYFLSLSALLPRFTQVFPKPALCLCRAVPRDSKRRYKHGITRFIGWNPGFLFNDSLDSGQAAGASYQINPIHLPAFNLSLIHI